jgi:hypothetical protein
MEKIEGWKKLRHPLRFKIRPRLKVSVVPTDVVRARGTRQLSIDASANPQRVKRFNTFSIFDILNINLPLSHYGIGRW